MMFSSPTTLKFRSRAWHHRQHRWPLALFLLGVVIAWPLLVSRLWAQTDAASSGEEIDSRRERLATLSVSEKRDLLKKKERFDQLNDEQRRRLRELHAEIQAHPDRDVLNQVLSSYTIWLSTLPQRVRAELADLSPQERLKEIQKLARTREDRRIERIGLSQPDARAVIDWWRETLDREAETLVESIPDKSIRARVRERFQNRRDRRSRFRGFFEMVNAYGGLEGVVARVSHEGLTKRLSAEATESYVNCETTEQKNELVATWIIGILRPPPVPKEKLMKLMEELPDGIQADLEKLPPAQQYERLEHMYNQRFWRGPGGMWDRGPDGGRRGRRDYEDDRRGRGRPGEGPAGDAPDREGRRGENRRPERGRPDGPPGEGRPRPPFDYGREGGPPPERPDDRIPPEPPAVNGPGGSEDQN